MALARESKLDAVFERHGTDWQPRSPIPVQLEPSQNHATRYPMPMSVLICLSTCPERDSAERIASALVDERLAACVNIVPGLVSAYRWQGKVERDDELLLIIKTVTERLDALRTRLIELHPHELPELIAVEAAGGLAAYLDWVRAETRPAS